MSNAKALSTERLRASASLFAALGDATRLEVVIRLAEHGPESISRLSMDANVSRQAITKHLEVLGKAGLVRNFRQGREHIWELEPGKLADIGTLLAEVSRQWDDALGRLKRFVEGPET